MKGVELPINVLVIVAVAVIVLLGLIALYMGGFGPGGAQIALQTAKNSACNQLLRHVNGCAAADPLGYKVNFDADGNGNITSADTLQALCNKYYGCDTATNKDICCRCVCGCPGIDCSMYH